MRNKEIMNLLVVFTILCIFIAGCKAIEKEPVVEKQEEVVDTGILSVESYPNTAQVYIGEEYKGDTPFTLYNLPVGSYDITIKKDGYVDLKKSISIKVGRTEEIDATLTPLKAAEEEVSTPATQTVPSISQPNKINLSSFAMYYDFDKLEFTDLRTVESDLFSRKYATYVHFTAIVPTKINVINKPISEVEEEDFVFF